MILRVRKLWFRHSIDDTIEALFTVPQMRELFEGWEYDGEMQPRGIKGEHWWWPALPILDRLPDPQGDVYLILTSLFLTGLYGGKTDAVAQVGKAIVSNAWFFRRSKPFNPRSPNFAMIEVHEAVHALGLMEHHEIDPDNRCVMENQGPGYDTLEDIRICDACYARIT